MTQREYDEVMQALKEQQAKVTASPEAARKFLTDLGAIHLFEPSGDNDEEAEKEPDNNTCKCPWCGSEVTHIGKYRLPLSPLERLFVQAGI